MLFRSNQQRIETPHLDVVYQPTRQSTFWDSAISARTADTQSTPALIQPPSIQSTEGDKAPKRIAIIASVYRYLSHAQHFCDRFLVGYPINGRWHRPNMKVVSLFVDQLPANDQSIDRSREFGFPIYPTITEALRCGTDQLAVDAVLLVVEHGEYPHNEMGQFMYPRYEFFKECVNVFEADGRAVPIYNDKHLSYNFAKAEEMVADGHRLGFPLLAGSSLPVTWRLPDLELPLDCEIEEALMIGFGISDPMDYHALEAMQCMVERRKGGEVGVAAVQMIEGEAVWQAAAAGRWSRELLEAALSRCDSPKGLPDLDGRTQDLLGNGELQRLVEKPAAYFIEYNDGLRATLLMLNGAIQDYCFAARIKGAETPVSTQFLLTPLPNVTYSACLVAKIEEMIESGTSPIPAERTLLVSGMLESCLISRSKGEQRLETPHLQVRYQAPKTPQHAHL